MADQTLQLPSLESSDEPLVIALVASTGGLQAIQTVLGDLREDFDAAIIVLLHQNPQQSSMLTPILARHCTLPIADATTGDRPAGGTITVVPPGCHLLMDRQGRFLLIESGAAPPSRPSADLLLATMATALGPRAVAVVLSGYGKDGATGATAVHELGGLVFATDSATSEVFAMPKATIQRDSILDATVPLEEVGGLLTTLSGARST